MPLDIPASSVDLTRQLCDIPSVSGSERKIVDEIEAALAKAQHLEVIRDGNCLVARTSLGRSQRVIIAGHIDTVPIHDNLPSRMESILDDGQSVEYLWGRGTVDMKAGVAVQLALAWELTETIVDVTWIWYDNEEVEASLNGLARLARNRPDLLDADFAVLGEPTSGEVEGGCNGTLRFDVTTSGLRVHSARPWVGENAIHKAANILETLASYQPRSIEVDGLVYRESLNAVTIHGGVAKNVIPDQCTVHINYRFAPSRTGAQAVACMRELFPEGEATVADLCEGARPGLDAPLAQEFMKAVGGEAKPKYGWTDVSRFSALGIPAINYGPGDSLKAHADDEAVRVSEILRCERGLRRWLTGERGD